MLLNIASSKLRISRKVNNEMENEENYINSACFQSTEISSIQVNIQKNKITIKKHYDNKILE